MATALHSARTRFFDKCGNPLCGGTVYTYQVGTTTAKPTYTDVSKTAVNTNPIILDSIGSAAIFLDGAYRVRVLDRNGVLVEDIAYIESWISATEKDKIYQNIDDIDVALSNHAANTENPHKVTKSQLGLSNVDNTADIDKPISKAVNVALLEKADKYDTYTKSETDNKITALSSTTYAGHKGYATLAAAQAAQASLPANTLVEVTNDTTASNNGVYLWDGTTLVKSSYDVLGQAKDYADTKSVEIAGKKVLEKTANIIYTDDANIQGWADKNGDIVANIDSTGAINAQDFKTDNGSVNGVLSAISVIDTNDYIYANTDNNGNIVFGYKQDGELVTANPSLKYGIAEIRADAVPRSEINALGIALDQAMTKDDAAYSFEVEVSPYQANGTEAQRMPAAIKIGDNRLYVAYTQYSVYNNDQVDGRLVARIVDYDLKNQTATVSATIPILGEKTGNNFRHPNFIRLKDRILLILNGNTPDLLVYESLDNCATWQLKTQIDTILEPNMPWALALDSVVRIESGQYAGRIVACLFYYTSTNAKIGTVYSDDNGATWQRGFTINSADYYPNYPTLNETTVACDAQNNLIFAVRNESLSAESRYIIFAKSEDGGQSIKFFEQVVKTYTVGVQIGMKQIAPTVFDGGTPKIIATHPTGNNRTQYVMRVSYDGCKTWAYDYKPFPMTDMVGYGVVVPLTKKDYAIVVEKGLMMREQSVNIKFINLKEVM